jgi:hypothetical protein
MLQVLFILSFLHKSPFYHIREKSTYIYKFHLLFFLLFSSISPLFITLFLLNVPSV